MKVFTTPPKNAPTVKVIVGESKTGAKGITGKSISKTITDSDYKEVAEIVSKALEDAEDKE